MYIIVFALHWCYIQIWKSTKHFVNYTVIRRVPIAWCLLRLTKWTTNQRHLLGHHVYCLLRYHSLQSLDNQHVALKHPVTLNLWQDASFCLKGLSSIIPIWHFPPHLIQWRNKKKYLQIYGQVNYVNTSNIYVCIEKLMHIHIAQ